MKNQNTMRLYLVLGVAVYLLFLILYLNRSYPMVGHDYQYFLSHMLDTYIHYLENGLAVQWFTPSFGGGLPAFPNPQHIQYSLPQLLVFLVNPWWATMVSISIYTLIGYYASYRLGRDILQLGWMASVLGALFFLTTGFCIQHNIVGHVGYQMFPLIALCSYLILVTKWKAWHRGMALGVIVAIFIHEAGFYTIIILGLSILMVIPLVYLLKSNWFDRKNLIIVGGVGGLTASLLSVGKIYAVLRFMQHFPRVVTDNYYSNFVQSLVGFFMQLIGVPLFTIPLRILREDPAAVGKMMTALIGGQQFGIWEMDISISPMLVFILIFSLRKLPGKVREIMNRRQKIQRNWMIAVIILLFGVWIAYEISSARGFLYDLIHDLPFFRSMHVNIRFISSFVLPLVILGAYCLDKELSAKDEIIRSRTFSFIYLATLVWLGVYFLIPNELQKLNFDNQQTLVDYQAVRKGGENYVSGVRALSDYKVFSNHATSYIPHEPIFGYRLEEFSTQLEPGSIYQEKNGYLNMTNPTSLVYGPDKPFTRFRIDQREMMEQFSQYQQPDWEIPRIQLILNAISGGTFLVMAGYGVVILVKRLYSSWRRPSREIP